MHKLNRMPLLRAFTLLKLSYPKKQKPLATAVVRGSDHASENV